MKFWNAIRVATLCGCALPGMSGAAFAHASDGGFILLLPTGYYLIGGAASVALSFVVLALMPPEALTRLLKQQLPLAALPFDGQMLTSLLSFMVVVLLWVAGFLGSRDPLSNPLPLVFWTVFWVGLTLLVGICGNLWRWLDPWYAPSRLVLRAAGYGSKPPFVVLPPWLGYVPAILLLFAFGWFELIYPAPDDPARLAAVLIAYWTLNFVGIVVFGHEQWTGRVELFSVFFGMIAKLSPFARAAGANGRDRLCLRFPGGKIMDAPPLPVSGMLFLLLALATVSFDGLMRTFFWLGLIGVNPLEFPGRSAVILSGTFGLLAAFAILSAAFVFCMWLGARLSHAPERASEIAGRLVWSIAPIALAYHFAHYLGSLVVDGQYALAAISDPLSRGWNLFGTAGYHVRAAAITGYDAAWVVWNFQATAIIGGHLLAVLLAHALWEPAAGKRNGIAGELSLAILMVGYTVFGLWLLSSPTGS